MKIQLSTFGKLVVTVAGIGLAGLLAPQSSFAQSTNNGSNTISVPSYDPQNNTADPYNTNNNPLSGTDTGGGLGVFDLIHRATLGAPNLDVNEQNQQLDAAAAAFKQKQQQLWQQQQPTNSGVQVITPQPGN